jgi:YD repeat-containing protein
VTTFIYDSLNRLQSEADALGHTTSYAYDGVGNRTALSDANGFTTFFTYDSVNRLTRINYPAPDVDVDFTYDAAGNRVNMDEDGDTDWAYDELNRVVSVETNLTGTVRYGYDAVGNRTSLTYPDGKLVSYDYDPVNRMTSVTDWGGQITSYGYDGAGRMTSVSLPNGVVSDYAYDDAGRLLSIFHQAGPQVLSSFEYTYDNVGNRVQVIENMVLPETPIPTPTETPTPEVTPTPALRIADFVLLGQEGVWVEQNGIVLSGDVGANVASGGPYLAEGSEVTIGIGARMQDPVSRVMGDSVYLKDNSQIYDAYYNVLNGLGDLLGQEYTSVELPLVSAFPDVPAFLPGTQNFDVPQNGSLSLDAGAYGLLKARNGSTIIFTGGVYDFSEWDVGENVRLHFQAPSEIRIAGRLSVDQGSYLGPDPGPTGLDARDIVIYVNGMNGSTGNLGGTPKAAKFGISTAIHANVYAPNGTLWLRQNGQFTGAFLAKWVDLGIGASASLLSQWSVGTGGAAAVPMIGFARLAAPALSKVEGPVRLPLLQAIDTPTPTDTPTDTPSPTASDEPTATDTPTLTDTATDTPTAVATETPTPTSTETPSETPTPTATPTSAPTSPALSPSASLGAGSVEGWSVVIDYTYDPLYRLAAADYSTGEFFHYSYDAVGNRLMQERLAGTNTSAYDIANRLIEVDGVPYTWDANGNLLNDGASIYTYNHARAASRAQRGTTGL